MSQKAIVLGAAVASAVIVSQVVVAWIDDDRRAWAGASHVASEPTERAEPASATAVPKGPDGHFWAEGAVDGRAVRFLVDTGATAVSLTEADARRLGLDPSALAYDFPVLTAQGRSTAARVTLPYVQVAGARVENVEALVFREGLTTSLLGMTYLGRLSRFEATRGSLVLHP